MSHSSIMRKHGPQRGFGQGPRTPLAAIRTAVPYRPEPRPMPARIALLGTLAAAIALGAGAGRTEIGSPLATGLAVGAALGGVSASLFRAAGTRPARTVALTALAAPLAAACAVWSQALGLSPALAAFATGMAAIPICTRLATRGGLFDDLVGRWFRAPEAIAYLHPIGRPLVPRDLRQLEPYSGDKPMVLVVLIHRSARTDGTEVISIVLRRRRAAGSLSRLAPFVAGEELMLPPTTIARADLELLMRHPGRLGTA
ncbi:MAG: hypothetical protein RL325_1509 [Planctomycetota bacterium]